MDRRQKKTKKAIIEAFIDLLEEKRYSKITVQEIIDRADVGRSTFYAHFETKDMLLEELCREIFAHVFLEPLHAEISHDFTNTEYDFTEQVSHILYHLRDHGAEIARLVSGESGEMFLGILKEYAAEAFGPMLHAARSDIPESFLLNYLTGSFADTVRWWVNHDMKDGPDEVAGYYAAVTVNMMCGR